MNNNTTAPPQNARSSVQAFHCHSSVYDKWSFFAEELADVSVLLCNPYHASTNYHRVTLIATPAQMIGLLQEHQHLMKMRNITTKP